MTTQSRQQLRGHPLQGIASPAGVVSVLALDHRDAMRNAFTRAGIEDARKTTMLELKQRIVEALAANASAIMLDPQALASCRSADIGVLVPLEMQGHQPHAGGRLNRLTAEFGTANAAALGVQGCKLLLYYRADHPETASRQRELLQEAAADCHRHALPLVVEPLVYRLEDEDEPAYAALFPELVVAAARELAASEADLLKLQFPGDLESCERVTEAATPLPWAVLGGGDIDGETFAEQLQTSCRGGACGFIAGRAIWNGALALPENEQREWLRREARPLFDRLTDIAHTHARRIR